MLLHLFSTEFYYHGTSLSPWPLKKPEQIWIGLLIDLVAVVQSLKISLFESTLRATATLWYGELLPLVPKQNVQASWLSQLQRVQAIRDDATVRFRRRWMFYVGLVCRALKLGFRGSWCWQATSSDQELLFQLDRKGLPHCSLKLSGLSVQHLRSWLHCQHFVSSLWTSSLCIPNEYRTECTQLYSRLWHPSTITGDAKNQR